MFTQLYLIANKMVGGNSDEHAKDKRVHVCANVYIVQTTTELGSLHVWCKYP